MSQSTILIVEDETILQDVYKLVLKSKGYNVATANNGQEGIAALKKHSPDLVLLDVFMPIMDGKEFMRQANLAAYPNTKVIVYSNLADSKTENEMLDLGAEKFILKSSMTPIDLLEMVSQSVPNDAKS